MGEGREKENTVRESLLPTPPLLKPLADDASATLSSRLGPSEPAQGPAGLRAVSKPRPGAPRMVKTASRLDIVWSSEGTKSSSCQPHAGMRKVRHPVSRAHKRTPLRGLKAA